MRIWDYKKYASKQGVVKKVDEYKRRIILYDGTTIPMDNMLEIEGDIFSSVEPLWLGNIPGKQGTAVPTRAKLIGSCFGRSLSIACRGNILEPL